MGNPFGSMQSSNRLREWMEKVGKDEVFEQMQKTGKHFIQQFTEANRDLYNVDAPGSVLMRSLDDIESYPIIFWVIPQTTVEEKVFENWLQHW